MSGRESTPLVSVTFGIDAATLAELDAEVEVRNVQNEANPDPDVGRVTRADVLRDYVALGLDIDQDWRKTG